MFEELTKGKLSQPASRINKYAATDLSLRQLVSRTEMVTFLITSVLFLGLFAIAVYFWQKPANKTESIELPPPYPPSGLFSDFPPVPELTAPDVNRESGLIQRAKHGDLTV